MENYWLNQVAVVTGAGGTLCSGIAVSLAAKGARLVLIGRSADKLERTAETIRGGGGTCRIETGDVTDEAAMSEIAARVEAEWGACRFLINGAGGNNIGAMTVNSRFEPAELAGGTGGFFDLDMTAFEAVQRVNTIGTVIPSRVFGRGMARAGRGGIVNFASMNSYRPLTRVPAYAMAKCAVVGFTKWLAVYLAPAGIRVNAVAPGFFVNERSRKYLNTPDGGLSPRGENVMHHTPMKRFGEASDLGGCVEWLLDDERAGFVTGVTVPVDGGFSADSGI